MARQIQKHTHTPSAFHRFLAPLWDPYGYARNLDAQQGFTDTSLSTMPAPQLLRYLESLLRPKLHAGHSGSKKSSCVGQGLEFADLREYMAGDDIRKIDWNVLARTGTPHIKEYQDEKQLAFWLIADFSPSMALGHHQSKAQRMVAVLTAVGMLLQQGHHKLGVYLMGGTSPASNNNHNNDNQYAIIKPSSGLTHLQHIAHQLLTALTRFESKNGVSQNTPEGVSTHLRRIKGLLSPQHHVILASDFWWDDSTLHLQLPALTHMSKRHTLWIDSASDFNLPPNNLGLIDLVDPGSDQQESTTLTHNVLHLDVSHQKHTQKNQALLSEIQTKRAKQLRQLSQTTRIDADTPLEDVLLAMVSNVTRSSQIEGASHA